MSRKPVPFHERPQVIAEADELFTGADKRDRAAGYSPGFVREFLEEASQMFRSAAMKYLDRSATGNCRESNFTGPS
jgi:hypothetical protein